jgi:hypothetical protein
LTASNTSIISTRRSERVGIGREIRHDINDGSRRVTKNGCGCKTSQQSASARGFGKQQGDVELQRATVMQRIFR